MERWRLYWHVAEAGDRFEVVGLGVARPAQEIPTGAAEIECPGGKEESIWLYRAVRNQLTLRRFVSREEVSQAVLSLLSELERARA